MTEGADKDAGGNVAADPQRLGHFVVKGRLGQGGMGIVYRARDERLRRDVALKVLPAGFEADAEKRRRFLREARSAAAISHPNIAPVYEVGEDAGRVFIAMELVEGESLRARLAQGPLSPRDAARLARGIARGLARAHDRGIVHRDLKPENVMIDADGEPRILDFGLAKLDADGPASRDLAESEALVTEDGRLLGTPLYMSPEQVLGEAVDARSDVFSLGVVLYEMCAGRRPLRGDKPGQTLLAIVRDVPPPLRDVAPDVPEPLASVVDRCLRKDPAERFASARELLEALEALPLLADTSTSRSAPSGDVPLAEPEPGTSVAPGRTGSRAHAPRWRRALLAAGGIGAAVLAGAIAFEASRTPAPAAAPSSAAAAAAAPDASPVARAVIMTDHEAPKTSSPEALAEYIGAIQAYHDAAMLLAQQKLERATTLDPNFGAAQLRLMLYGGARQQTRFAAASQNRAAMSDRDRELLTVIEPLALGVDENSPETGRRAAALAAQHPEDAEVALIAGMRVGLAGDAQAGTRELQRALALDPSFALALHELAALQARQGDWDGAQETAARCLALTPVAASCARRRAEVFAARGQCADMEQEVRVALAGEPNGVFSNLSLASVLVARNAPPEAVGDALQKALGFSAPDTRPILTEEYEARRAAYVADFGAVIRHWREAERLALARDPGAIGYAAAAMAIYEEIGDTTNAAATADEILRHVPPATDGDLEVASVAMAELHRAGRIAEAELRRLRDAWLEKLGSLPAAKDNAAWIVLYALPAATPEDAREAMAALPRFPPFPRAPDGINGVTLWEEAVGRMYLLAGARDDALTHLRAAARGCRTMGNGFTWVHAHEELGETLAANGDRDGACAEFRLVVSYWGGAKPRSITAERARKHAATLRCDADGG